MSTWTLSRHHGYLEGVGGLRLHYRTWEPAEPRAAVLLVHCLGEHGGRYAPLAERLAAHGFVTVAPDLRGHGRSDGRRGHVSRFDVFLQDLDRFRRAAQGLAEPEQPLFLLAAGFGGLVALRYLQEFGAPAAAAVLVAPWVDDIPLPPATCTLARLLGRVLPAVRLSTGLDPARLTGRPAAPAAHHDDPLAHGACTPRFYREALAAIDQALQRSGRLALPLLLLLGGGDRARGPDPRRIAVRLRSLGAAALDVRRYAGRIDAAAGGADGEAMFSDIVAWLEDRLEGPAAGTAAGAGTVLALRGPAQHTGASP